MPELSEYSFKGKGAYFGRLRGKIGKIFAIGL